MLVCLLVVDIGQEFWICHLDVFTEITIVKNVKADDE